MQLSFVLSSLVVAITGGHGLLTEDGSFKTGRALLDNSRSGEELVTPLYAATRDGGLALASNYTLTVGRHGKVSVGQANTSTPGFETVLAQDDITRSSVYLNAACLTVSLNTTAAFVGAFVSTYDDFTSMSSAYSFDLNLAVIVGAGNLSARNPGPVTVHTSPKTQYTLAVYSLDLRPQQVAYGIVAYPPGAPECTAAPGPAPGFSPFFTTTDPTDPTAATAGAAATPAPTKNSTKSQAPSSAGGLFNEPTGRRLLVTSGRYSNGPAPEPSSAFTQTAQINRVDILTDSTLSWPGGFTNASCIAYKVLGQPSYLSEESRIDLSVFVLDEGNTTSWTAQDYALQPTGIVMQAACLQNTSHPGSCGAFLDGLNTSAKYFLWAVTGMQRPDEVSDPVILDVAFTAQAKGSCAGNAVQQYESSTSSYLSNSPASGPSSYSLYYIYDYEYGSNYYSSYYHDYGTGSGYGDPAASPSGYTSGGNGGQGSGSGGSQRSGQGYGDPGSSTSGVTSSPSGVSSGTPPRGSPPPPVAASPQAGFTNRGSGVEGSGLFPLPG